MEDDKRVMELDRTTYAVILNSLIDMKNNMRKKEVETDIIDKVIVKVIKAPSKQKKEIFKRKGVKNEER